MRAKSMQRSISLKLKKRLTNFVEKVLGRPDPGHDRAGSEQNEKVREVELYDDL